MEDKFRSRKFLITFGSVVVSSIGLFIGKIEGVHYAAIISTCVTAYSFSNAAQYFAEKGKKGE